MSASPRYAWPVAERACFDLLNRILGSVENIEGFLGKFPRKANKNGDLRQWCFRFTGGGDPHKPDPALQRSVTSFQHEATFEGRFYADSNTPDNDERAVALDVIGLIRDNFPAGRDEPNQDFPMPTVAKIYLLVHPTCESDVCVIDQDADGVTQAGEVEIWKVTATFSVVYDIAEHTT